MLAEHEKVALKHKIQANKHEIFVVSIDEMDTIVRSSTAHTSTGTHQAWTTIKRKAELGANYYASADDLRTLSKLVGDLGSFGAQAYVKSYGGKPHIILKGHPGLRRILTGTKYGMKNPKVIAMGLGKAGATHAARSGGLISIVLLSTYRVSDYFLSDQATLSQLIGALATDVVKVGLTTGASILAAGAVAGGFTLAVGPILAVVIVGVGVSWALGEIDQHYGITDRVIAGLDELGDDASSYLAKQKERARDAAEEVLDTTIDYAVESARRIIVSTAQHYLRRFTFPLPRAY